MAYSIPSYTLVGAGRLARHLKYYFSQLGVPLRSWARKDVDAEAKWPDCVAHSDVILLAISDRALPDWTERQELRGKTVVHFAGSRSFPSAFGFHPLMSFSHRLYAPEFYREIPFVADRGFDHRTVFPFLQNRVYEIDASKKPLYHALSNMAANFPAALWVHVFQEFQKQLDLPREILRPMLEKIVANTLEGGANALAGPLRRGDIETLAMHEDALAPYPSLSAINRLWTEWAVSFPPMEKTL